MNPKEFVEANFQIHLDTVLKPWLKIPSISSSEQHNKETYHAASFLEGELKKVGLEAERIKLEKGNDLVYAERIVDSEAPTVLIYGHYDIQPIHFPEKWITEPFKPEVRDGKLYARGSSDDKGQIAAQILAMKYFNENGFPLNIKFIAEGNEEGGGSSFEDYIKSNPERLSCDALIISDTGSIREGIPGVLTSLRGIAVAEITNIDVDSLVEIIHKSHNRITNKILIDGFYDNLVDSELNSELERFFNKPDDVMGPINMGNGKHELFQRMYLPTNSPLLFSYASNDKRELGNSFKIKVNGPKEAIHSGHYGGPVEDPALNIAHILAGLKEEGVNFEIDYIRYGSHVLSTAIQPSGEFQISVQNESSFREGLEIVMIKYAIPEELVKMSFQPNRRAYQNENFKNNFGDGKAKAYMSFRLVQNLIASEVYENVEKFIKDIAPNATVINKHTGNPFRVPIDNPFTVAMINAMTKAYDSEMVDIFGGGGSIPITDTFYSTLNVPILFLGMGGPHDGAHGPNESISIDGLKKGTEAAIYTIQNISEMKK